MPCGESDTQVSSHNDKQLGVGEVLRSCAIPYRRARSSKASVKKGLKQFSRRKGPRRGLEGQSLSCTSPENARRKFAACEALLAAVKIALSSSVRREIHDAMYSACRNSPLIPRWAQRNAAVSSAISSSAA